ncbi:MAG: metallophosphoesterase, partial [Bradymonadales bacterium]|nr:metallophosphoesterase [Bradymonadales bacterium]
MRLLIAILSCLTLAACLTEGGVFVESSARFSPASEDPVILDGPEVDQADEPISGTDQLEEPDSTPTEFDAEAPDSQPESDQGGDSSFILVDGGPDGWRDRDAGELPEPELFTFVVYGDSQFSTTSCTSGVSERLAIPQVIMDLDPNFILHTGDLVNDGWEDGAYDRFRTCYADMLALIPLFPTMGNHDAGSGGITQYKTFLEWQLFERNPEVTPGAYSAEFPLWYEDDPIEWSTDRSDPSDRDLLPSGVTWKTYYAFRHQNAYFISFEQGT